MAHIKLKSKEFNMSHFSTDLIADQAIDTVANMSDHDVKKALFNAGKRVLPVSYTHLTLPTILLV